MVMLTLIGLASSFKLSAEKPMLFMAVVFAVSGIRLTFKSGLFPTAIAFTQRIGGNTKTLLALSTILGGLGQSTAGVLFGVMNKKTRMSRSAIVVLGTVILAVCLSAIYVTFPRRASLEKSDDAGIFEPSAWIVLVVSFVFGIGDGCWSTQIFAFIVARYADRSAQGFSIFMFFQSLLTCAAFYYGTLLDFHWHIYILTAGTTIGAACYYMADVVMFREYQQVPTSITLRETN
ncbi:Ion channel regulatory protein [Aphelenchoides avenae]|nr:Ion channel regulatory protein [Aphelenchus avenae]